MYINFACRLKFTKIAQLLLEKFWNPLAQLYLLALYQPGNENEEYFFLQQMISVAKSKQWNMLTCKINE